MMQMIQPPFYNLKSPIIERKYTKDVGVQLPDGDFLVTSEPYGLAGMVEKINRETGQVTTIYNHGALLRLLPLEVLDDGNVILLGFDYPYYNHRLLKSTDNTLSNFTEVLQLGYMKPYSKHGIAHSGNTILLGEYIGSYAWNEIDANTECKIWKSEDNGTTWTTLYAFKRNTHSEQFTDVLMGNGIQHMHFIEYDKYSNSFWIGTGDTDRESSMWRWNEAEGFTLVGRGYFDGYEGDDGQYWRAIALEFFPDCVMWGTDGYKAGTWIMRYDRLTGEISRTTETRTDGYMFYSGILNLPGDIEVALFSGTTGTIYYSIDRKTAHVLKDFSGENNRVSYTYDKIGKKMIFNGNGNLTLDGQILNAGAIRFEPRIVTLKFLD